MTTEQIFSIIQDLGLESNFIEHLEQADAIVSLEQLITEFYAICDFDSDQECILALMEHSGDNYDDCEQSIDDGNYSVLTNDEANIAWTESIDNCIDECVLPDLPETAQHYFDRDAFTEDAKIDGRGHSLSGFDGSGYEQTINDTTYYIYRNN